MNARQKAKKLKKELDRIKCYPMKNYYSFTDIPSEHLKAYRVVPLEEIERYGVTMIDNEVRLELSRELMNNIRERLVISKTRDLDRFHAIKYTTDVWIGFGGNAE